MPIAHLWHGACPNALRGPLVLAVHRPLPHCENLGPPAAANFCSAPFFAALRCPRPSGGHLSAPAERWKRTGKGLRPLHPWRGLIGTGFDESARRVFALVPSPNFNQGAACHVVASSVSFVLAFGAKSSVAPLLLLSPANPLRWASPGPPILASAPFVPTAVRALHNVI